jgi:hypothetical protein
MAKAETIKGLDATSVGNGAAHDIKFEEPYLAQVELTGVCDLLFHRWNNEAIEEKSKAAKGSAAKKSDNVESYVYRNEDSIICLPGAYLKGAIVAAAKFRQDPRSPRKSAMDLYKAGVIIETALAPMAGNPTTWDYEHAVRVTVQRNGITRIRPAFRAGWVATFDLQVTTPEYIDPTSLQDTIVKAGRLVGVGDFRPSYGRFAVTRFEVLKLD